MHCFVEVEISTICLVRRYTEESVDLPSSVAKPGKRHVVVHMRRQCTPKRKRVKAKQQQQRLILRPQEQHQLRGTLFRGDYYSFLMTHPLKGKKTDSTVCYTKNPLYELYLHNERLISNRLTSVAAPFWVLECVLGPFASAERARECCNKWVQGSRGKVRKRKKAPELADGEGVNLYTRDAKMDKSFLDYLKECQFEQSAVEAYERLLVEYQ
jgi:hypothetical protein